MHRSDQRLEFERIIELPVAWTCVAGRFGVHLFQGRLTVGDMDRMDLIGAEWQRKNPGKRVELVIVLPSEERMDGQERSRMIRLIRRWEKERIASATVILAQGLIGAMHRSVLTGLMMVARPPHPAKVFGTIADAVAYLTPHISTLGSGATQQATLGAVLDVYEAFRSR
jgi:hypothetical protein